MTKPASLRTKIPRCATFLCDAALCSTAILAFTAITALAAAPVTEITLPGTRIFPESLTSMRDGTLIIGSLEQAYVSRIAPGKTAAEIFIQPHAAGMKYVLGVYADEKNKTLWVCSDNLDNLAAPEASLNAFDLITGVHKASYSLPGTPALCNDVTVSSSGIAYVSDTHQDSVWMLRPGAKEIENAAKDPLLKGIDGLAFGDENVLYANSFFTGKFLRVDMGTDGKSKKVTELKLSRPLDRPDGMRTISKNRLLMAENSGKMDIVTFEGPDLQNVLITTIKEGLLPTMGVTPARGMAWIAEGKNRHDPAYKDHDPGPFKLYAVPLPKP